MEVPATALRDLRRWHGQPDVMLALSFPAATLPPSAGSRNESALSLVSLVVADYDEAIDFFTRVLGFEPRDDTPLGGGKRWVGWSGRAAIWSA